MNSASHAALSDPALSSLLSYLRESHYHFVTPTPATHDRVNRRPENEKARSIEDVFGWSRPFEEALLPQPLFRSLQEGAIIAHDAAGWKSRVRASTLDGEIYLHSAFPTTAPDAVFFGPDSYRFARAVGAYLDQPQRRIRRALDVGCGAGVGGIVIAKRGFLDVTCTDINAGALKFARLNAAAAGAGQVAFVESDLFENTEGQFDLIVANPPYLNDPLKRAYRHGGGDFGSALSISIVKGARSRLSPGGCLLLYTGAPIVRGQNPFLKAVRTELDGHDLDWCFEEIDPDVFGEELDTQAYATVDRIAATLLTVNRSGDASC